MLNCPHCSIDLVRIDGEWVCNRDTCMAYMQPSGWTHIDDEPSDKIPMRATVTVLISKAGRDVFELVCHAADYAAAGQWLYDLDACLSVTNANLASATMSHGPHWSKR